MTHSIAERDRIQLEARQAAHKYADLNAACPYPWGSAAAIEFKREFETARAAVTGLQVSEVPFEQSDFQRLQEGTGSTGATA
jgi:hypothetical protein